MDSVEAELPWRAKLLPLSCMLGQASPVRSRDPSNHFDQVGRDPDVDLPEPDFQALLELGEELAVLGKVRHIDENASQVVAKSLSFMLPEAVDDLRLVRDSAKSLFQLDQRVGDEFFRNGLPVIEPQG